MTIKCPACNWSYIFPGDMEPGTEFRCPHCKEWFRVEEMLDSEKPPNLTKEQAERLGTIKLVHLDKEEVEGLKANADTGEWEN